MDKITNENLNELVLDANGSENLGTISEKKPENPLGYEKISTLLKKFAIPSIIAMIVSALYNIVDQIFIGQGVGMLGNGATNVAFPLTTICLALSLLVGIGSSSLFSLSLGRKDDVMASKCVGAAIYMTAILGVVYAIIVEAFLPFFANAFGATEETYPYVLDYVRWTAIGFPFLIVTNAVSNLIRADGNPKYSMLCMVVGAIINTILDPLFIFVFNMGVSGAAIATVISQIISFVIAISYISKFKQVTLTKDAVKIDFKIWGKVAVLGLSNAFNQVAIAIVQITLNNLIRHYGALSIYGADIPLAACGVIMKVNSIFISVFVGFSQGSQPIFGFNYGAKQYDRVRKTYFTVVKICAIVALTGTALFQLFPRTIISIFGSGNELYYEFAEKFMRIFLSMLICVGIQIFSSNLFSAIGKPFIGVILSLSRQVLLFLPLVVILPTFMGLDGIIFAGPIADVISFTIAMILVFREFKIQKKLESSNLEDALD